MISRGLSGLLLAQFLTALGDNTLLFTAIALLQSADAPSWHKPLLLEFFVFSYIVLAPFVGAFADALPKSTVMLMANSVKFGGCICMMLGMHPLLAYGIVGVGAAVYSPAKYGILTEMLSKSQLVSANGWVEGSTVLAIILGAVIGGAFASAPQLGLIIVAGMYFAAAFFNLFIPRIPSNQSLASIKPFALIKDFSHAFVSLWGDKAGGQVSLSVTTLFWGAGATLRLVVIAWASVMLAFNLEHATQLTGMVAFGVIFGSIIAARYITIENSVKVLPAGIMMGLIVISMMYITNWIIAAIALLLIGILSGIFLVPLNALLQHRGHHLIGPGHSIAVQNFNENLSILIMGGAYALMVKADMHINTIVFFFGAFVIITMSLINRIYKKQIAEAVDR